MTRRGTLESVIGGGLELLSTYAASKSLIILVGTKADLWEQYRHRGTAEQKQELINLDQASEVPNSLVLLSASFCGNRSAKSLAQRLLS